MTTFVTAAGEHGAQWVVAYTIEGDGDNTGQYRYCTEAPDHGGALYRDWISEWPVLLSERVDPEGGVPEAASLEIETLDFDDTLTSTWKVEAAPSAYCNGSVNATTTSIVVDDASGYSADEVKYLGAEAVIIDSISVNTLTVTRGALDTEAHPHDDGAALFDSPQYLMGRRIRLYMIPKDSDAWSDGRELGVYHIDGLTLSQDLHSFRFSARSQAKYLSRVVANYTTYRWDATPVSGFSMLALTPRSVHRGGFYDWTVATNAWSDNLSWMVLNDEVLRVSSQFITPEIMQRGELGTVADGDVSRGEAVLVMGADPTGPCAFRFHPYAAGYHATGYTRTSNGWTKTAHAADIMLCILTSSARTEDGFETLNGFQPAAGHAGGCWSSLPIGYGMGVPASKIDLASFITFKAANPQAVFPYFYFGHEPISAAELLATAFLRPLGAFLTTEDGTIKIKQPRFATTGATSTAWGADQLLGTASGGQTKPEISASKEESSQYTSVTYVARSPRGHEQFTTYRSGDVVGWGAPRSYYGSDARDLRIDVPSLRAGQSDPLIAEMASRKLFRLHRPRWRLSAKTGIDQYAIAPGDLVALTFADLPDEVAGARGWTGVRCEATERAFSADPGFTGINWELFSWGPGLNAGWVAPSFYAVSVSGPDGEGDYKISGWLRHYCDGEAQGDMPSSDPAAFAVNDEVMLLNPDGSVASAAQETVTAVGTTSVTVSGNWSGTLTAGLIVAYDDSTNAAAQQTDDFAYWSYSPLWRYGDL